MSQNKVNPAVVQQHNEVENAAQNTNILNNILKYQHFVLGIFGLYHEPTSHWLLKTYCCIVGILLWVNFFKFINVFNFVNGGTETFNVLLVLKIVCLLWLFGCCSNFMVLFFIQQKKSRIHKFSFLFGEMFQNYQNNTIKEIKILKRITIVITTLALGFSLFNSITCFVSLFGPKEFYNAFSLMTAPFHKDTWVQENIPYKLFCSILVMYSSTSWLLTIAYYVNYCLITTRLLDHFNSQFKIFVANNETTEDGFDEFRKWHLKLGSLIGILNVCFKELIAIQLMVFVPIMFLILYIMSDWNGNCVVGLYTFLYPFWLAMALFILVLVIVNAGRLNTKYHESLKDIFNLKICNYSNMASFKVQLMINKLSGDKTGLTAWGFFVIDRAFILSVGGTVISYFILMTRFKSQSQEC